MDIHPGDRAAQCEGMMQPAGLEVKEGEYIILHRCTSCGFERKNKAIQEDDFDAILKLSKPSMLP